MTTAIASRGRSDVIVTGEFALTRRSFEVIAGLLRQQSGIHLAEAKATLVYSRLAKRLRHLGCVSFEDYCALIESSSGAEERNAMLTALTTNVTRFFREPHHFEHLRSKVLPALIDRARAGGRVRLWSSACSSGEEPYSIALTVLGMCPDAARLDIRILATDIDTKIVARAKAGLYSEDAVSPIPPALRSKWMTSERSRDLPWSVNPDVKSIVTFNELNLIGQWPMRGRFDVIFCRNVVIYFEEDTQSRIWGRFAQFLAPGARLYVGHSERVDLPCFASDGLTVYRLAGSAT